jgi:hypothetical protein
MNEAVRCTNPKSCTFIIWVLVSLGAKLILAIV